MAFQFTKKADYALRTMQFVARRIDQKPISAHFISQKTGIPQKFLQGIISELRKAKILIAIPGPKGGIALARNSADISVLDIIQAVEGPINLMNCLDQPAGCTQATDCGIMPVLAGAQHTLLEYLRNTSLKLMASSKFSPFAGNDPALKKHLQPQTQCPVMR